MKNRNWLGRLVNAGFLLALAGCGGGGEGGPTAGAPSAPAEVTVLSSAGSVDSQSEVSGPLRATAKLADGSTVDITAQAEWRVTGSGVEVITEPDGAKTLKGAIPGVVTVTIVYQGKESPPVQVVIGQPQLLELSIVDAPASTTLGSDPIPLKATAKYSGANVATQDVTHLVKWSSSDPLVATVGGSGPSGGLLEAKKIGRTKITAKVDGSAIESSFDFEVKEPLLKTLTVEGGGGKPLLVGEALTLTAVGHYADDTTKPLTAEVTWNSTANEIASVDKGLVKALKAGNASISLALGDVGTSLAIMVEAAPLTLKAVGISVTQSDYMSHKYTTVIPRGLSAPAIAHAIMSDGNYGAPPLEGVEWSSSDPSVFAVVSMGLQLTKELQAKGKVGDKATITATHRDSGVAAATVVLEVGDPLLTAISTLTPDNFSLSVGGGSQQLSALGTFTDNTEIDVTSLVNCLAASSIVSIDNCLVTGLAAGVTTVDATLKTGDPTSPKGTATVTVSTANAKLDNLGSVDRSGIAARVPDDGAAVYVLSGATPGALYTLRVPSAIGLQVAADAQMASRRCEDTVASNGTLACTIQPTESGSIFFTLQGPPRGASVPVALTLGAAIDSGPFAVKSTSDGYGANAAQYVLSGAEDTAVTIAVKKEGDVATNWVPSIETTREGPPVRDPYLCVNEAPSDTKQVACGIAKGSAKAKFGVASAYGPQRVAGEAVDVRVSITTGAFGFQGTITSPVRMRFDEEKAGQVAANGVNASYSLYEVDSIPARKSVDFLAFDSSGPIRIVVRNPNNNYSLLSDKSTFNKALNRWEARVNVENSGGGTAAFVSGFRIEVYATLDGSSRPEIPTAETGGTAFKLKVSLH